MPIKDNKSNTNVYSLQSFDEAGGATIVTTGFDTANIDNGVTFFITVTSSGDPANTISLDSVEQSPDNAVWSAVPTENLIGDITNLQNVTLADVTASVIGSLGVFGVERYIRFNLITNTANTGNMAGNLNLNLGIEIKPGEK